MSWFPHQAPVVSLHLIEQRPDAESVVIDVFPHRWTFQRGPEDAILSFVAGHAHNDHQTDLGVWYTYNTHTLTASGYACDDFAYEKGGFVAHHGSPVGGHTVTFQMEGRDLVLPDGTRLNVRRFAQAARNAYNPTTGDPNRNALRGYLTEKVERNTVDAQLRHHSASFFLGVAEAFVASPAATELRMSGYDGGEQFAAIAARVMRNLTFIPRSGQDAIEWIYQQTRSNAASVFLSWAMRPDRGWSAERWVLGDLYPELCALCPNPIQRAAGKAAGSVFFASQQDHTKLVGDSVAATAHGKIATRFLRDSVENAALRAYAADPTLLKPMAARKAIKLAAA